MAAEPHNKRNVTQLLADYPKVQQTVHNILALLQNYGPLTLPQMEYNLPQQHNSSEYPLSEIIDILGATGVVRQLKQNSSSSSSSEYVIKYTCGISSPQEVILPHKWLQQIQEYHREINSSRKRAKILEKALLEDGNPKTALRQLFETDDSTSIMNEDPVFAMALKNCHVLVEQPQNNSPTKRKSETTKTEEEETIQETKTEDVTKEEAVADTAEAESSQAKLPDAVQAAAVSSSTTDAKPPPTENTSVN